VPANEAASSVGLPVPPIAASRSHTSVRGQAPHAVRMAHIPARMSPPRRLGIMTAPVIREYPQVIASTGSTRCRPTCPPAPTGTGRGGNHRSHWATWPGA
jgi:hypothetical protein